MDEEQQEERGQWYRSKLAARIPRHRRGMRAAAFVVLGAVKVAGTGLRVAGRGVRDSRRRRRAHRVPGRGSHCGFCGVAFRTVAGLNQHYQAAHVDEPTAGEEPKSPRRAIRRPPGTARGAIRPAAGRPANRGAVVASVVNPPNPRAQAAVDKYREHIDRLGVKAMSDSPVAQMLRRAAAELEDQNPRGRMEMNEQVAAIEAGLMALAEAVDAYALHLKRDHPRGKETRGAIAPELVNPHFREIREKLDAAAQAAARYVASFEDINSLAIRAAKGQLPNGGPGFLGR